jgi:hypothetical protein
LKLAESKRACFDLAAKVNSGEKRKASERQERQELPACGAEMMVKQKK